MAWINFYLGVFTAEEVERLEAVSESGLIVGEKGVGEGREIHKISIGAGLPAGISTQEFLACLRLEVGSVLTGSVPWHGDHFYTSITPDIWLVFDPLCSL